MPDPKAARAPEPGEAPRVSPRGWRKRHPVLARVVLYAVLLGVLVIPAVLWVQARERYLWARVEQVSVEVELDHTGARALASLDKEFVEWGFLPNPALSDPLRARAERMRGVLARLRGDRAEVDRAFQHARELDPSPASAAAIDLEWARCVLDMGDRIRALVILQGPRSTDLTLALLHDLLLAQATPSTVVDDPERRRLDGPLGGTPLPPGPEVWYLLAPWRPAMVALEATRWLAEGLPAGSPVLPRLWRRLLELAPADPEILLQTTEALLAAGDTASARSAWRNLRSVDPKAAERALAQNGALKALDTP
jgi:hypothetical protein